MDMNAIRYLTYLVTGLAAGTIACFISLPSRTAANGCAANESNTLALNYVTSIEMARSYADWLDSAIADLSADDEGQQRTAAEQLGMAVPYAPDRARVLAALQPHLYSHDNQFALLCVQAYAHWATKAQVPELAKVEATPPNPPQMSRVVSRWVEAAAALVRLDPAAARASINQRAGNFFYRSFVTSSLQYIAQGTSPSRPAAAWLLLKLKKDGSQPPLPPAVSPTPPSQIAPMTGEFRRT